MAAIHTIPKEVEKAFGEEGTEKFILFLNQTFEDQKKDMIDVVEHRFQAHVTDEVAKVRLEVADLRTEVKTDIAGLRVEVKTDIAYVHRAIADVQKAIANQTRWLPSLLLAGAVIYPIAGKILDRLLPASGPAIQMEPSIAPRSPQNR